MTSPSRFQQKDDEADGTGTRRGNSANFAVVEDQVPIHLVSQESAGHVELLAGALMTAGLGGSGCINQSMNGGFNASTNIGCYRMAIARTTNPLEWQAFNYSLVSDLQLPTNAS